MCYTSTNLIKTSKHDSRLHAEICTRHLPNTKQLLATCPSYEYKCYYIGVKTVLFKWQTDVYVK